MSHFPYALKEITKHRKKETNKRYCDSFALYRLKKMFYLKLSENNLKLEVFTLRDVYLDFVK